MEEIKIDLTAALALKKTIEEEAENLSEEQELLIDGIYELGEALKELEFVKAVGLDTRLKNFEEKLKRFEGLIDDKYQNDEALFCIGLLLSSNSARTLDEAIAKYEEYKNIK